MNRLLNIWTALVCCLSLAACNFTKKKETDWSVNFSADNKSPYGLFLAYKAVDYLFTEAKKEKLDVSYNFTYLGNRLKSDTQRSLVVIVGQRLNLAPHEADSILSLVSQGHQVLIAVASLDEQLMEQLKIRKVYSDIAGDFNSQCITLSDTVSSRDFCYRGYPILNYFRSEDSTEKWYRTIGTTKDGNPDLIAYSIGKGRLFLHASPFIFTNYFLLQNNNQHYLEHIFSYIKPVKRVLWMNFNSRELNPPSGWEVLWRNRATRIFLLMASLTLLLYVLFEMRRKQKAIPVIAPNINTSVVFVETIGRLYYNKGNHKNLAEKMVQHFLEFVRNSYSLNTSQLNSEFVQLLAAKSGKGREAADMLVWYIKEVMGGATAIDDSFLFSLHSQIQEFYNKS